jgi:fatty-acyl-CoA synthase
MPFAYHKDPAKTAGARHPHHPNWTTLGDIGRMDEEGYLFLTDRQAFMIISGGVNIYPREIEDALVSHPAVRDVAVFGVPSADMGEDVKAVLELVEGAEPSDALAGELLAYLDGRVARYMIPRSIDFIDELPRLPTGKLYKKALRDQYWRAAS